MLKSENSLIVWFFALALLQGCSPGRFIVKKVVDDNNPEGFRYYLPRPYLLITNMTIAQTPPVVPNGGSGGGAQKGEGSPDDTGSHKKPDKNKSGGGGQAGSDGANAGNQGEGGNPVIAVPSNQEVVAVSAVTIAVIWLPDFKHEYAVSVKGGTLGSFNGALQLANGWMLVGVNQQGDSGTAQTVQAVGGFLGTLFAAAGLAPAAHTDTQETKPTVAVVEAEVPSKPFFLLFRIDDNNTLEEVGTCRANMLLVAAASKRLETDYWTAQCPHKP
jgi:hypothetical protein